MDRKAPQGLIGVATIHPSPAHAMTLLTKLTNCTGVLLAAHAAYSAHEQSLLHGSATSLPPDIIFEALVSVAFLAGGLVLGAEPLRPVSWSAWAGEIERDAAGRDGSGDDYGLADMIRSSGRHPYARLENRIGFWDVKAKRKEFADWVKNGMEEE